MNRRGLLKLIGLAPVAAPMLPKILAVSEQRTALGQMFFHTTVLERGTAISGGDVGGPCAVGELVHENKLTHAEAAQLRTAWEDAPARHQPVLLHSVVPSVALPVVSAFIDDVGSGP